MAKTFIATLLTDFGLRDPYVAATKGAILARCPRATIIDISHEVGQGDLLQAAIILSQAAPSFPPGTVHVVVVDPGVGTDRRILVAKFAAQTFVFPDNGVITMVADTLPMEAMAIVASPRFLPGEQVSRTFHGRDIFAPLAAEILNGLPLERLGPTPETYKTLAISHPRFEAGTLIGEVIYVDGFGNLVTNITEEFLRRHWDQTEQVRVSCGSKPVGMLLGTYGQVTAGEPLALINSMGAVEVASNLGSAAEEFGAGIGTQVRIEAK